MEADDTEAATTGSVYSPSPGGPGSTEHKSETERNTAPGFGPRLLSPLGTTLGKRGRSCHLFHSCFPGSSVGKESARNAGDTDAGSIPMSGTSCGEGNGNPLQDSCLENSMDRGACWVTAHGVAKSQTRLSN